MKRRRRLTSTLFGGYHKSGIAWFTEEEYPRVLEVMLYPTELSRDYNRWREIAENQKRSLQRRGRFVVPIEVDAQTFVAWCDARALNPNFKTLRAYVEYRATGYDPAKARP